MGTILVLGVSSAWAQQRDLEVTMDVVPANTSSAGAAGEIKLPFTLPQSASDRGREASTFGQETSSLARDKGDLSGREFGQTISEAARTRVTPTPPGKRP